MNHNILIICATHSETRVLKNIFGKKNDKYNFLYLTTGIGNYKALLQTTLYLSNNSDIDLVINFGVCGYTRNKDDIVQVFRIKNMHSGDELLPPPSIEIYPKASIYSSETPVFSTENADVEYVDMESYGIELALEKFLVPRLYIKIPIDKIGDETKHFDKDLAKALMERNISRDTILSKLDKFFDSKIKKPSYFDDDIFNQFSFTFTQKEILKKQAGALKALSNETLMDIYNEKKYTSKNEYLKAVENKIKTIKSKIG